MMFFKIVLFIYESKNLKVLTVQKNYLIKTIYNAIIKSCYCVRCYITVQQVSAASGYFTKCQLTSYVYLPIFIDYYMSFSISALVLARDSHIKPEGVARA